ncbi:hypothetical protein PUN28_001997 [Cardiocondyla obscurior]|uniref:Uncharacterized protein n=1 Tax=Cardiocondyla obscurior TaxID=286306 RepID=A0AAW2GS15_9HYME
MDETLRCDPTAAALFFPLAEYLSLSNEERDERNHRASQSSRGYLRRKGIPLWTTQKKALEIAVWHASLSANSRTDEEREEDL